MHCGSVANRPLEQINAGEQTRRELAEPLFLEPHPNVRRVVFIATPHGGSSWATRPVGQLASALARSEDERSQQYARLMAENPGVFHPAVERRLPTSVDMLEPKNPLLVAMRGLPVSQHVPVHSIVGTGGFVLGLAASDGVVPEESAPASECGEHAVRAGESREGASGGGDDSRGACNSQSPLG